MGAGLIQSGLAQEKDNPLYDEIIERSADYIMNEEFRLEDGTFCREYPRKGAVWADDLYMSVIFLSKMGNYSGDSKYLDEAARQVIQFTDYLMDDYLGIYNHAYFDDIEETNGAFWGRANGWVMMAQVELLSVLPEDHPRREELMGILNKFIKGISKFQSSNGLWHQLLNKNDSYLESSCTAMFTYSIAKAVNEGWIDSAWSQVAWKGWGGLYTNITEDAQVKDICVGTHIEWNLPFYYHRPKSVNDTHGLASTILAGAEVDKMSENYGRRISPRSF
jgi:rhamnogalacturonyl hydrolase YesR